ncbi:MAG: hypothetical protein ABIH76_06370 [Candidatus Bathyarchaeota archaeon]
MKEGRIEVLNIERERKKWRQLCPVCGRKLGSCDPYDFGADEEYQGDLPSSNINRRVQVYFCGKCDDPEFLFLNGNFYNYRRRTEDEHREWVKL